MRRRIISSSTSVGSYPEPTASECHNALTITGVSRNTISLSWSGGATDTRAILLVSTAAITINPIDFASIYTANANYSLATNLENVAGGTLPRVLWDGVANTYPSNFAAFAANTIYYFKLLTFKANANNDFNTRNYNTINVLSTYTRTSR